MNSADNIATETRLRAFFRYLLAIVYFIAGMLHLIAPAGFLKITPGWVPYPEFVVLLTGVAEIAGAAGLLTSKYRKAAAIGLALYAICVWPANFNHAYLDVEIGSNVQSLWYHIPRLPFQLVVIWWALYSGGVTNWPLGKAK